eukprot:gene4408-8771_t
MSSQDLGLGLVVGLIPCIGMTLSSILLMKIRISGLLEATLQNFAAGLILAAVAAEIFPLLEEVEEVPGAIGLIIGFTLGLLLIYGLDGVLDKFSDNKIDDIRSIVGDHSHITPSQGPPAGFWELLPANVAFEAISNKSHKLHIIEHLTEMQDSITHITTISDQMLVRESSYIDEAKSAETIDETVHELSYKLDHCRRLIQGAESTTKEEIFEKSRWPTAKKIEIHSNLLDLKRSVMHIIEHLQDDDINFETLEEIRGHMDDVEILIHKFHNLIDKNPNEWIQTNHNSNQNSKIIQPMQGDTIPMGLIIPIVIDAFIDGFLIGLTYSLHPKAGIILSLANLLEMSILGMTLAAATSAMQTKNIPKNINAAPNDVFFCKQIEPILKSFFKKFRLMKNHGSKVEAESKVKAEIGFDVPAITSYEYSSKIEFYARPRLWFFLTPDQVDAGFDDKVLFLMASGNVIILISQVSSGIIWPLNVNREKRILCSLAVVAHEYGSVNCGSTQNPKGGQYDNYLIGLKSVNISKQEQLNKEGMRRGELATFDLWALNEFDVDAIEDT